MRCEVDPYVRAGAGPDAFDCSGLAACAVRPAPSLDIAHDRLAQAGPGRSVERGELRPGDPACFQDTRRPGRPHTGVCLGDGWFIRAENGQAGGTGGGIGSVYYASRRYGAVRLRRPRRTRRLRTPTGHRVPFRARHRAVVALTGNTTFV